MVSIEQIHPELTWRLRRDVLYPAKDIREMEMPEDNAGIHFGAFKDNRLAGVISLFQQGTDFQFRKFAVDIQLQKQGVGTSLLGFVSEFAVTNRGNRLWCNARLTAAAYYEKLGFQQTSEIFTRGGHDYVVMEKWLPSN
jgi:predicted N-acetyltransferase YhbS